MAIGVITAMNPLDARATTFGDDVEFLRQHSSVVVLTDPSGRAQVTAVPAWQGRVMTSTAGGLGGTSFGWVNRELIASGQVQPHINVLGGEDRFWLGPEGGQFSIFFAKGVPFDLDHWFTPIRKSKVKDQNHKSNLKKAIAEGDSTLLTSAF